jgi:uncharacterized membrane protein
MTYIIAFAATLIVFAGIDLIWLGAIAKGFYRAQLGNLMASKIGLLPAIVFYMIFAAGLVHFAVRPALVSGAWTDAATAGALLGFVAYATYDLTNLATLRDWPPLLTVVDLAWGTMLSAASATGGYWITRALTA